MKPLNTKRFLSQKEVWVIRDALGYYADHHNRSEEAGIANDLFDHFEDMRWDLKTKGKAVKLTITTRKA